VPQVSIDGLGLHGSDKTFVAIQHGNTVDGRKFLEVKA
jgi:hypothetical protein